MKVVPLLLLRGDEEQHQIGADGKVRAPGWRRPWRRNRSQALHAGLDHGGDVVADGIHLGVKFAAEHAVAKVDEAGAGIFGDFARAVLERFQDDDAWRLGNFRESAAARSNAESSPCADS